MNISKPRKSHVGLIIAIALVLIIIGTGVWYLISQNILFSSGVKTNTSNQKSTTKITPKTGSVIHIVAMGDMLAHDTIIANAKTGDNYDFAQYFANIRPNYKDANVVFCNQEGLSSGEEYGISGYPSFNAPKKYSADLQSGAGCNLINLANNHMGDKGVAATNTTIDVWTAQKPLAVSGANKSAEDQDKVSYATVNGIKIGFLAFADFNNNEATPDYSINIYHDEALVRRLATEARKNADVVIVSMHWGVEDSSAVSADQEAQAKLLSSLGVDVIIGTGPHVLQSAHVIDRAEGGTTVVWYSLGNMLSSQLNIEELIGGIASFDINKSATNVVSVSNLSFKPTYMHYEWTAAQAAGNYLLARKNAMLYLLDSAADPLSRSLFNTTIAAQKQYVVDTLGPEVTVK